MITIRHVIRASLLILLISGAFAAQIRDIPEALSGLGAPEFKRREAATRYLIEHGGEEEIEVLKKLWRGDDPEVAIRARRALRYIKYGLSFDSSPPVLAAMRRYWNAGEVRGERMAAVGDLVGVAKPGEVDLFRMCMEVRKHAPESEFLQLAEWAGKALLEDKTPDKARVEQLAELILDCPREKHLELAQKFGFPRMIEPMIAAIEPELRRPLYAAWYKALQTRNPDLLAEDHDALNKSLARESEAFRAELAHDLVLPHLSFDVLAGDLDIDPETRGRLITRLAEPQKAWNKEVDTFTGANELARVMLMWGDESLVPTVLDRGIREDDARSMRALTATVFLQGELAAWTRNYRQRFGADPSDKNRRVLAHLLKAADRYEEAWALLTPRDQHLRFYEQLAIETGHWSEAYDAVVAHPRELDFHLPRRALQYHLCALFLAQHAGREVEIALHLKEVFAPVNGADKKRHIQRLLIARRPQLAHEVARDYGLNADAFEILTVAHDYAGAFQFASNMVADGRAPELLDLAVAYFDKRAPEKAAALRALAPDRHGALHEPGPAPARAWFVSCEGERDPEVEPGPDHAELAEEHFEKWRRARYSCGHLHKSGFHLSQLGDPASRREGLRRMRLAGMMPLAHPWADRTSKTAPRNLRQQQEAVVRRVGLGIDDSFSSLQRKQFQPLRKRGDPKKGALLWACAHYHILRMDSGIRYGSHFWALNNGMHTQEGLGLHALVEGRIEEAERRLAESWRLSIEPTWLGAAVVKHYREAGNEAAARRVFDQFRTQLERYAAELPGDKRFPEKLAEWRDVTGFK